MSTTDNETLLNGRSFGDAFYQASIGNAIGHGVFRPAMHYAGRGISASGRWIGRELRTSGIIDPGGISLGSSRMTTGLAAADPRMRSGTPSHPGRAARWDENHPLIEGSLDKPRSPEHRFLQQAVAEEMQASGYYQRVSMRQRLSEFSGRKLIRDIEPDNIGMTIHGQIDLIEIMSKWDTRKALQRKLRKALHLLPEQIRGQIRVIDPKDAFR